MKPFRVFRVISRVTRPSLLDGVSASHGLTHPRADRNRKSARSPYKGAGDTACAQDRDVCGRGSFTQRLGRPNDREFS
jgi:hypothetical protein